MTSTHEPRPLPTDEQLMTANGPVVEEFRSNNGRIEAFQQRYTTPDILLITTKGARTGREQVVPLGFMPDGDDIVIIASKQGNPRNPAWYYNLKANPIVTVELPGEPPYQAEAILTEGEERTRRFNAMAERSSVFAGYQARTTREIPVFVLRRVAS
ncbi:MAG: nitroreductase/quinone reductase family protein [Acidimicrobiia bacterium]